MVFRFSCVAYLLFLVAASAFGQKLDPEFKTRIGGLNTSDPLVDQVFFGKMKLRIPESLVSERRPELEEALETSLLESEDKTVQFDIKMKGGETNLKRIKKVHESMAESFYRGRIHRSEITKINGKEMYVFEMTGYWNGAKTKESWIKFFTVDNDLLYQCLIRYPEEDRIPTAKYRQAIMESLEVVSEMH